MGLAMIYEELTYRIIGCAMKVHRALGCGFQEVIYQRALKVEFGLRNIQNEREMEMDIFYEGVNIGTRRVDFFVANKIMVELKAVAELDDLHLNQAINYLEAYNLPVGLLINFGNRTLQYKRVYNTKHPESKPLSQKR
jgi:GxxExxY protein